MSPSVVLIGVSGSGKTTVGLAVAKRLGRRFVDADDLHPPHNRAKLAAGEPLTDADRAPWLAAVRDVLAAAHTRGEALVVACSALRDSYRRTLEEAGPVRFAFLTGPVAVLRERLAKRKGHFVPPSLLDSQLETLEPPADALGLDIRRSPEELAAEVASELEKIGKTGERR